MNEDRAQPTKESFVHAYDDPGAAPPWDIGRPQPDMVAAFEELAIAGSAIDLGCGTGEHVLELARRGLDAWGLDSTAGAIAAARGKAADRDLPGASWVVGDALDLAALGRGFDTVLDCGLFHVIAEPDRRRYLAELDHALPHPGARHLMLGFQANSNEFGPRGYTPEELRSDYFPPSAWTEEFIRPATYFTRASHGDAEAWLSSFVRRKR